MGRFISILFLKLLGWKPEHIGTFDIPKKCVVTAAPHTTYWDALIMVATFSYFRIPVKWALKDEFMKFPLKLIFKPMGAIGINRRPKKEGEKRQSTTEAITQLLLDREELMLAISPEGTRTLRKQWKTGFYYIAKGANVPILFGFLDFAKKQAGLGGVLIPGEDMEADMVTITDFYRNITPKFPEKFSLDERYDREQNAAIK